MISVLFVCNFLLNLTYYPWRSGVDYVPCLSDKANGVVLRKRQCNPRANLCFSRCGTTKVLPCSMAISVKQSLESATLQQLW